MSSLRAAAVPQRRRSHSPFLWKSRGLVVAVAVVLLVGGGVAFAASTLLGGDPLTGPPASAENDAALRALFPPYQIGHATQLAERGGRKLFGARTARGGYCFSATSPTDPKGEGGHCVSHEEARTLTAGGAVAFAMSGWSVGGYAPSATSVRISGAGLDETVPVNEKGWWIGVARLPVEQMMQQHRLPNGTQQAAVIATSVAADGREIGRDQLMLVHLAHAADGRFVGVGFASD
jgi:hypothetical protein